MTVTVTSKGQVTLPVEARRRMGIKAGTKLEVIVQSDKVMEVKMVEKASVRDLKGFLPKPRRALSVNEINEAVVQGALL